MGLPYSQGSPLPHRLKWITRTLFQLFTKKKCKFDYVRALHIQEIMMECWQFPSPNTNQYSIHHGMFRFGQAFWCKTPKMRWIYVKKILTIPSVYLLSLGRMISYNLGRGDFYVFFLVRFAPNDAGASPRKSTNNFSYTPHQKLWLRRPTVGVWECNRRLL